MGSFQAWKNDAQVSIFRSRRQVSCSPVETRPQPEDLKGSVEVDIKKCTLCQICEKRCPTGSIKVDKENETWSIDRFDCIQCRTCVRECPFGCLTMTPNYKKPATSKGIDSYKKPELTEEEKAEKARKEAEKAARIKAAKEAKAAREAAKKDNE